MWQRNSRVIVLSSLIVSLSLSCVSAQTKTNSGKSPLKTVAVIPMPGPAVRFDYQSLDPTSGRLYIAHMNADHLVVFDTATRKVIANLGGFARVHGVWAVPELARVFASVTGDREVAAVDTQTLRTVAKVGPINYPDGIAYAPGPKRVFVSDEHGNTDAVIDAQTNNLIKEIDLGGGAGNTVYEPTSGRILVAVHEKNDLVDTDFADADVDLQNFNLTPYPLFYPEKRQFFLENAGVFNFPLGGDSGDLLFFSRQIGIDPVTGEEVPVNVRAKVTGSLDNFQLGVMEVNARESGPNPAANYLVGRVKRSLWSGSYIGVMGIDKTSGNPNYSYNQAAGADTRLVSWRNLVVNAYAAQTRSPGVSSGQTDVGIGADYRNNWLELFGQHRMVGPNFNPEVGFLERTDCICDYLDGTLKPRLKIRGVRELNFVGFIFHAPDTKHVLQTQEWQATFRIEFHNGSYSDNDIVDAFTQRLTQPFNIYKNVYIPVGLYHWGRHQITYGTPLNRRLTMSFLERFSSYYNGHLNEARVRWSYRANERLSFDFSQQWNRFRLPIQGGDFDVLFGGFQTNYSFSRFLALSTLVQLNTADNQAVTGNVRLRWNYRPDSDLFIIYTAGQRFASLESNAPQYYQNSLTIKFTYSWRP